LIRRGGQRFVQHRGIRQCGSCGTNVGHFGVIDVRDRGRHSRVLVACQPITRCGAASTQACPRRINAPATGACWFPPAEAFGIARWRQVVAQATVAGGAGVIPVAPSEPQGATDFVECRRAAAGVRFSGTRHHDSDDRGNRDRAPQRPVTTNRAGSAPPRIGLRSALKCGRGGQIHKAGRRSVWGNPFADTALTSGCSSTASAMPCAAFVPARPVQTNPRESGSMLRILRVAAGVCVRPTLGLGRRPVGQRGLSATGRTVTLNGVVVSRLFLRPDSGQDSSTQPLHAA